MSKHLKRLLALLLAVVMIVGLFPTVVFAADEAEPETRDLPDSYIVGEDEVPACEPVDEELPADFNIEDVETELSDGRKLGKIPDLHPGDHELAASGAKRGTLPATYNSNTYNYITSVKNQGNFGTCWAHGALASCEAYMIKNGVKVNGVTSTKDNTNLSEYQLAYYAYHDAYDELGLLAGDKTTPLDDYLDLGGNGWIATYDLMRWEGPVDEVKTTDMAYSKAKNNANLGSTYAYQYNVGHVQDAIWIPTKNMSDIKQAIMTYGAGTFGYCHEDEYEQGDGSYYNPNSDYSNHDVTVVGWDDNYSKSKFNPQPSGNGAWIIKNSWGDTYGTSGYYYISYYDVPSKNDYCYFYVVEPVDNYDHNYQYDGTANIDENSYISAPNNSKFANVFTAQGNSGGKELLEAVAVNVWDTNTSFRIQIYTGGSSTDTPESGTLAATQDVSFTYEGYHTVKLNTPVTLNEGEKFSVIFQNTSGKTIHMPIDKSVTISGWLSTTKNHPSNSTYYSTGSSGGTTTYANYSNTGNLRIKAYTSDVEAEPEPCTITLKDNQGNTWRTISATTGTAAELPVYPVGSSTEFTFVGWLASAIGNETTTTKPTGLCEPSGDVCSYTPSGNVTLYPCFTTKKTVTGGGSGAWTLLEDASKLAVGMKVVFASNAKGATAGDISSQIMASIDSTFSSDKKTITSLGSGTVQMTVGGSSGAWTFSNGSKLLGATAAKKVAWGSGTTTWSVSISNGDATIQNGTSTYGRFLYNVGSPRFIPYTSATSSSMLLPQIYYQASGGSTTQTIYVTTASLCNHNYQLTDSEAPTCTEIGLEEYTCSLCNDSYLVEIPALGHTWGSWTPVNDLVHERSCTVSGCDGHEEASHNYTISTSGLTTTYTCTLCNHSYNRTLKSYTVNFSVLGDVDSSESCTEGESVNLPATATSVEGYEFRGWVAAAVDPETETQPSILTGTTYAPSGDTTTITLYALYSRIEGATSGGGDYTRVTSTSQLTPGSKVVIAASGSYNYALGATQNKNNRSAESITKSGDTISFVSDVAELTLMEGNDAGTFAFYDSDNNGYLYAATGGNYLRVSNTLNDWTITFNDGVTTLTSGERYLKYNTNNTIFSCYSSTSSGVADVVLYIQSGSAGTTYFTTSPTPPCAHPNKQTTAAVAATCTTAGNLEYFYCPGCGNYYKVVDSVATQISSAAEADIAALGHDFNGEKTQIANNDAFHSVQCTRCSETSTAPHTFGAPTINGLTQTETCTACGYEKTSELTGYTVTYNVLGKDAQKVTVAQGSSVTLPTASAAFVNETEDGYTFAGWVTAPISNKNNTVNPGTPMTGSYTPTGNVTLYALYTKTDSTTTEITIPAGYSLATSVPAVKDKIIIALKNGNAYYAFPNANKSSSASIAGSALTVTDGQATASSSITFEVYKDDKGNVGLKSTEAANYIGFNSGKLSCNGWGDTKYCTISADGNGAFKIDDVTNGRALSTNGTNFTCVNGHGNGNSVYIFKYQAGGTQQTTTTTNYYTTQPAAARYIVTAGTCTNGSVVITDPQADYAASAQVTLTATPATGFAFSAWTVTGTVNGQDYTSAITGNTLTVPAADVTVTATFVTVSANEYTVDTTDITGNGSVTANPAVGEEGDPITLTVAPNTHYHLVSLTVDGLNVTAQVSGNTYTFNMPDHDVEVSATFAEDAKYTVTLNPVTGGNLVANKTADIYAGEEITVTANPAVHYTFEEFNFTGLGVGTEWSADDNVLAFTMPANNVTVSATFIEDAKYTVTVDSEIENGTVTASKTENIYAGETITLTATPDTHYTFGAWQTTPSVTVGADGKFTMPASNVTVSATFNEDPKATVTFSVIGDTEAIEAVTNYVGEALVLPDTVTVEGLDEDYSFIGWATTSTNGEDVKTLARVNSEGYKIPATDTVLYAVFTRTEEVSGGGTYYEKVTAISNGTYIIVNEASSRAYSGIDAASNYVAVDIADGKVADRNGAARVEIAAIDGGYSVKILDGSNAGKYISGTSGSNGTNFTANAVAVAISITDGAAVIASNSTSFRYNATSGQDRFRFFKDETTGDKYIVPALYKEVSAATYYNTDPEVIHKYTLTVDTNIANGSVTATAGDYEEGDTVNLSYAPTTGYQFDGYVLTKDADSSDVTAIYISGNILTMPAFDVTLSANFSLIPATYYSVTPSYNAAGGSISVNPSSAEEGDEITVTISPNTHWTLTSLTVNGAAVDLTGITDTYTFELAAPDEGKDVPVVAVFTEDAKYTVTIDPAVVTGGTLSADKTADIYAGETVTLTATPDAHYTFDGWQCTAGGATISGNTFTMPAGNVTLSGSFTAEAHISVTFHAYSAESQPVTTAISDKYYNGDTVLAADVPAVEAPNGYVFMGWYGSTYAENASAPAYVTPAGTAIGSTALNFYAVYGKSSAGSSPYFKLSLEYTPKDGTSTTCYVGGRTGTNKYLNSVSSEADAAEFGIDAGGYLYFMDGSTKTYISSVADGADISFATNIGSATPWTVTENNGTVLFQTTHSVSGKTNRYFSYNVQSPRFAAYNGNTTSYPREFTKIGGPSYDSYTTDPARIAPVLRAVDDTVIFDRDRAVTFNVLTNDDLDYLDATGVTVTVTGTLPTGVVNNNDGTFTFTPSGMQSEDITFTYTITDKADSTATASAIVTLKPAERVYYDETNSGVFTFAHEGTGSDWTDVTDINFAGLAAQEKTELDSFVMYSGGSAKKATVSAANKTDRYTVSFSFAGTGFEIISAMTNNSGAAKIEVYQGNTKVKGAIVDTYRGYAYDENNPVTKYTLKEVTRYALVNEKYVAYTGAEDQNLEDFTYYRDYVDGAETKSYVENKGNWYAVPEGETVSPADNPNAFEDYIKADGFYVLIEQSSCWVQSNDDDANTYQIPILRMMGLTYGTYTVKVQPIYSAGFDRDNDGSYDFIFDGVNIYDPTGDADYKYISLNDIVAEQGFGSVEIGNDCDHPTSGGWTFAAPATGTAEGSFAKYCTECEAVTASAKFTATATAEPTVITAGATSALTCTLTSENQEVQAILDAAEKTAAWTSSAPAVLTVDGSTATGVAEGTAYATLTLTVGGTTYASGINTAAITVNAAPAGYTATFHVPEGAAAPAAITQTGASITLPAAVPAPASCDAHTYAFAGWVKSQVAYNGTAPAASDILAEGESVTLDANTDFYALYTYQVGGSGGSNSYKLITDASTLKANDKLLIVGIKENEYYAIQPYASGNNCKSESVSDPSNATITLADDSTAAIITLGGSSGSWTLYDGAKYLYAAGGTGSNNYLKGAANADATNAQWTISCAADGKATIVCVDNTVARNTMRFNTNGVNDPLFACYASGQNDVYLYRQEAASAAVYTTDPGSKVLDSSSAYAATCTEDGYTGNWICSECGEKLEDGDAIPALGHNYEITSPASSLDITYTCSVCHDSYIEYYEYAVTYVLQPGVEVSGGSRNVNDITLPTAASIPNTYDAQTYTLVGWADATSADGTTDPSTYEPGDVVNISADTTFYPVYSYGSGGSGGNYVKVTSTSDLTNGQYLIVYANGSVALDSSLTSIDVAKNTIAVTISNNTIPANTTTNAAAFTFDSSDGSFKGTNGKYIGHTGTSNTLNSDTSAMSNTVSIDTDGNAVIDAGSSYVLRYNNTDNDTSLRFRFYKGTQQPIQLYKLVAGTPAGTTYTFELQQKAPHYSAAITPTRLSLTFGATATLTATLMNNSEVAMAKSISYSSNNNNVVTVNASTGALTAGNTEGTAVVTATVTAPDDTTYTATCTVYVSEESDDITVNYIGSETGKVYNWGTRGTQATFLTAPTTGYYTGSYSYETLAAMSGDSGTGTDFYGSQLGSAIHLMLVAKQTTQTSYDGTKNLYAYTDCIESDTAHTSGYYTGKTLSSTWDSGSTWNREHVWPSSKCINTNHGADGADIMMLRPESANDNSGRGNTAFGESSGYYNPDAKYPDKAAAVRGDVARNVLYTLMRWGNTTKFYGTNGVIESRAILIKWMNEDPVDTWELARNDAAQRITGVRNIFVDYPELAYKLLGADMPANYSTPSSFGIVAKANYSETRPSNYEPVTMVSGGTPNSAARTAPASSTRGTAMSGSIGGLVVVDGKGNISTAEDFKEYGPNYGVYLAPGQALVFKLSGEKPTEMAIGAKAINSTPAELHVASLNSDNALNYLRQQPIASAAEQYYALELENLGWNGNVSDVIIVYNAGDGILDVTNLRYKGEAIDVTVGQKEAQKAARMIRIVYGAPITEPDPIDPSETAFRFNSASLALQSDIGMIFYVDEAVMNSAENVYASFTKALYNNAGEITGYAEANDYTAEYDEDLGKYFFRFDGINPAELGSAVTATLNGTRDGELITGKTVNYSVLTYINNMYGKVDNAEFRALLADLAAYGEAAQKYVSYNTANLVTDDVTDGLMAYATAEAHELSNATAISGDGAVKFTGAYLSLREKVTVCYMIDASEYAGDIADLELRIFDGNALIGTAAIEEADGKYIASFSGLNALQMRTVVTAEVYNGDTCVSNTLDYSVESYAASKAAGNDALAALVNAMMSFGISAEAYFAK